VKRIIIAMFALIMLNSCLLFGRGTHFPTFEGHCPYSHPIKGNLQSYIFHTSESPYYERTIAEICFEDDSHAKKAGFRKAYQRIPVLPYR
jgi:hypothetical protein